MPGFETRDRTRIHYEDWGSGRPIVFVHSWGLSSRMWQYVMAALAEDGRRVVAYDRRGHGRSDHPGSGYDYDTLADDLAGLLEHLDLREVTLVTHSMGEGEGVRYLSRHGRERVERLVLVSPLGPWPLRADDNPHGLDPAALEAARELWKRDLTAWMDATQDGYFGVGLPGCDVSDGLVEWTRQDMLDTSLWALLECNRTGAETDRRPDMRRLEVPTLVVHGDHDASIPVELSGQVCADLIPGAKLLVYENAPHGLYLTHADRLVADIAGFAP